MPDKTDEPETPADPRPPIGDPPPREMPVKADAPMQDPFTEQATLHSDLPTALPQTFRAGAGGIVADTIDRNAYDRTIRIGTPLRIFGMDFQNNFSIHDRLNDFPDLKLVYLNADSSQKEERVDGVWMRS